MIERFLDGLSEKMQDPDDCSYMTVVIPGDLDPFERHHRFSIHIDAELRLSDLGCSVGGGTLYDLNEEDEDGDPKVICCILDVDATDVAGARALLRLHLPELGAPDGTLVQFGEQEDRFEGVIWHLDEPRSIEN